jgi:DNA-binding FadR family transcriptional regulator
LPLHTVEPTRLYRQIADQIASLIARGEFRPGERLPAERELATLLGVSRTSVREAIICLELAGQVEVRVGTGIFIREARPPAAAQRPAEEDEPGPFALLEARSLIEGEIAARAARLVRKADLDRLGEAITRMRAGVADFAQRDDADRDFHVLIAQATGNPALAAVVARLWTERSHPMWRRMEAHLHTRALHAMTVRDHEAIVAALAQHDPEGARAAMHRHLTRVAREFQRRFEDPGRPAADRKVRSGVASP